MKKKQKLYVQSLSLQGTLWIRRSCGNIHPFIHSFIHAVNPECLCVQGCLLGTVEKQLVHLAFLTVGIWKEPASPGSGVVTDNDWSGQRDSGCPSLTLAHLGCLLGTDGLEATILK